MRRNENGTVDMTQYFLQFCYTCQDAHECMTEEECKECAERYAMETDAANNETRHLLQMVHA